MMRGRSDQIRESDVLIGAYRIESYWAAIKPKSVQLNRPNNIPRSGLLWYWAVSSMYSLFGRRHTGRERERVAVVVLVIVIVIIVGVLMMAIYCRSLRPFVSIFGNHAH
ncbi:hypothetical protein SAY87_000264 [Trapa incisa]|uniref:Uncharacterized protein n=1 Tax=Trapa incisa TaxID=236973 RepID=A0AAN7GM01_9MYRT|nr:hypothetical protein SAY87_000264 [Trapa incisa]